MPQPRVQNAAVQSAVDNGPLTPGKSSLNKKGPIRYAVIGQGYISQIGMLPAFAHAKKNSVLVALISDDPDKLQKPAKEYDVPRTAHYNEYDALLASGDIDAIYIALPNHLHANFTVRAARAGVHVLCEKPMAISETQCQKMITACEKGGVKLMIVYRMHFEKATLSAIETVTAKKLGDPSIFHSIFTLQMSDPENYRLMPEAGGGPLYDIGIYCINAARSLFASEPVEVYASAVTRDLQRFPKVEETMIAILHFPEGRLAMFTCSFGASHASSYDVIGSTGRLHREPAYHLAEGMKLTVTTQDRTRTRDFPKSDQFAPQLVHFSDCILQNRTPEPSGIEGLNVVRILRALHQSAKSGHIVRLPQTRTDANRRVSK